MSKVDPPYRGLSWHKYDKRWRVKISFHDRSIFLGNHSDPVVAAMYYDVAARQLHGPDAELNFPRTQTLPLAIRADVAARLARQNAL